MDWSKEELDKAVANFFFYHKGARILRLSDIIEAARDQIGGIVRELVEQFGKDMVMKFAFHLS